MGKTHIFENTKMEQDAWISYNIASLTRVTVQSVNEDVGSQYRPHPHWQEMDAPFPCVRFRQAWIYIGKSFQQEENFVRHNSKDALNMV